MTSTEPAWEQRIADLWAAIEQYDDAEFVAKVEELTAELAADHPVALFELASALDSTGRGADAAPRYRQALASGLTGIRRRRATIQLASTLRNLGHPEQSVELLVAERTTGSDELDDAVDAFLALALADTGRPGDALALALGALSKHLPRYNASLARYAEAVKD
ncbi:tetratricopeptide repeat protein [Amycolatopsis nigrescens]|uniref:tetratricopeptide repeat protein n=1 Tax=Amycolatopsis nigrescens TaxID=381445 RepID=UPI00035F7BB1|nr:tetratricopeptide repeat protein [Amycolatopsis nigrescens]